MHLLSVGRIGGVELRGRGRCGRAQGRGGGASGTGERHGAAELGTGGESTNVEGRRQGCEAENKTKRA